MDITQNYKNLLSSKQDIVYKSNIRAGDGAITVHVAGSHKGIIAVNQIVVNASHVGTGY